MLDRPVAADPDDGLAQPTRARLFALLEELGQPTSTAELAQRLGLHPNGVRLHLERLEREGLLQRQIEQHRRGRPRHRWSIALDASSVRAAPRAYGDLSRWLARTVSSGGRGLRVIEATGREIGREIAAGQAMTGADGFQHALGVLGFRPERNDCDTAEVSLTLGNCPYRDAVRENPPAICALHRGITRGLVDILLAGGALSTFEPHDPDRAGCRIGVAMP
jgi:predicted ArsR family transcriptional regulator